MPSETVVMPPGEDCTPLYWGRRGRELLAPVKTDRPWWALCRGIGDLDCVCVTTNAWGCHLDFSLA